MLRPNTRWQSIMLKSAKTRRVFLQVGLSAWGALVLAAIALFILQSQGILNIWQLPIVSLGAGLAGAGCLALLAAGLMSPRSRTLILFFLGILLILLNGLAYFGAYTLTHFNESTIPGLAFAPKPENTRKPAAFGLSYVTERIAIDQGREWLETWRIPAQNTPIGTVILFPGNGGNKAHQLMLPAQIFHELGYTALMVDFRGQGGSSGNSTTLGLRESEDVALALAQAERLELPKPYVLYGVSMGSAAILRAVDGGLKPDAVVLELPFAYLLNAVKTRMRAQGFPTFGIAELLVFWGGIQHGYNSFAHNPAGYAKSVTMPALILHGENDRWTRLSEIEKIHRRFQGPKELLVFPEAGHNLLSTVNREYWKNGVERFLKQHLSNDPQS